MVVDTMTARAANRVTEHKGKTYYFCTDACKKRFDADSADVHRESPAERQRRTEGHGEHASTRHGR